ncbi:MAG TPA: malto-oligosyltrehalose trehalohydrolase [Clostridia bacterium]|nr:malto-oligosyltrehalose trehalohydrolase [Clostridia bacterium]
MRAFRVWAPKPRRVELVVGGLRLAMKQGERGWWELAGVAAEAGMRYGFALDGGEVRPDPRSPSQPDGVLGLSEVVDHSAYAWNDGDWRGMQLPGAVLYELHPGTFSADGTFDGIIEHLPHLVRLGVDAIELMPVAEFSGDRGWGYDGADLFAPHHVYGGPAGLKRLVDACHSARIGVVIDVVYNHLGPAGNFLSEFGPYFSDRHRTDWGAAFNFDGTASGEVRRFVVDNALMWIRDYHVDGLRLDAVHAIVDQTPLHILEQLALEVERLAADLRRSTFVIAESELNDPRFVRNRDAGGYGLDAAWADDWHHSLHSALTGERTGYYEDFGSLEKLGKALRQAWVYDGEWSAHRQKTRGRRAPDLPSHSFVIAVQNHDQVGNRAAGDRMSALMDEGSLQAAAALLLTAPFTPMLFQGEEWAASSPFQYFTDHADPELGAAVREGRRREFAAFGWLPEAVPDPQDRATFDRSKLVWDELDEPYHRRVLDWYRALIELRRRLPVRRDSAGIHTEVDDDLRTIVFERDGISVRVNLGKADWISSISEGDRVLMSSVSQIKTSAGSICLPPSSVVILETPAAYA